MFRNRCIKAIYEDQNIQHVFDRVKSPLVGIYIKVDILALQPFRNLISVGYSTDPTG